MAAQSRITDTIFSPGNFGNMGTNQNVLLKLSLALNVLVLFSLAAIVSTEDSIGVEDEEVTMEGMMEHIIRSRVQELSIDKQNLADQGLPILASRQRMKRETIDESCRLVSNQTSIITNSSLIDLLNDGYQHIAEDGDIQDAILILGDDKSGKTELANILTGDLSKIYADLIENGEFIIVDEQQHIQETLSQLQIIFKQDNSRGIGSFNSTMFLSVPSINDKHGPINQDLTRHFILHQIVNKVTKVKLLFLLAHSSLHNGGGGMDIDLLVTQAINTVTNIQTYKNSIGLVITKSPNYNENGQYISDLFIQSEITALLETYKINLESQLRLTTNATRRNILDRKLDFLGNLLAKNENGDYGRISFSRNPNKCGVLSNSTIITDARERITRLCSEELEYSFMEPKNFNFPLEDAPNLGLTLRNFTTSLNSLVSNKILRLMNDFKVWHENKLLQMTGDIISIIHELRRVTSSLGALMVNLTALGNSSDPQVVLDKIALSLEGLDYKVSMKVEKFMLQQQTFFEWLDEISPEPVARSWLGWIRPVDAVQKQWDQYLEWYEFCENLQTTVESYDWQLKKPKLPRNEVDLWDFLEKEALISVPSNIRDISSNHLARAHAEVVDKILKFALRVVEVECEGDTATITGNFVRLSEFMSKTWPFISQCDSAVAQKHVEVYVAHTLFLDEDVDAEGMELNLVIVAPNWVVVGDNRHINLNGSPGRSRNLQMAQSGPNSDDGVGFRGEDGLGGLPGQPGGSFFGIALRTKGVGKLKVTSIGGKGGSGQHGGNGGRGGKHRDATFADSRKSPDRSGNAFQHRTWYDHEGFPGYRGGSGGDGGAPGEGGESGKITILLRVDSNPSKITIISGKGIYGEPGRGGEGGSFGSHGNGIHCSEDSKLWGLVKNKDCSARNYAYGGSRNGPNGVKGRSSLGLVRAKPPNYFIVEWQSILNFKMSVARQVIINETNAFLQFLEEDPTSGSLFNIHGFIQELEKISKLNSANLNSMLSSYIARVEGYQRKNHQTLSTDEKKVITYLLMTAHSKLLTLEPSHGMGIVVDVRRYFEVVQSEMEKFKTSSALVAINEEKDRFKESLKKKIEEVRNFQNDVVTPAMHHAEVKLKGKTNQLARQLENIILHHKDKFLSYKKSLTLAISEKDENAKVEMTRDFIMIGLKLAESFFRKSGNFAEKDLKNCMRLIHNIDGLVSSNPIKKNKTNRAIFCLGDDTVTHLYYKFRGDPAKVANLTALIKETEKDLEDVCNRKLLTQKSFFPVVESLRTCLVWMISEHQNKSETGSVEIPELRIRQWQMTRALKDVKKNLAMFGKGVDSKEFESALDRIQDALTMQLNLFEFIVKYEETGKLAQYVTAVNSASLKNIHVKDPTLSASLAKMEKAMAGYYLRKVYHRAVHAFKQWVFPFAKLHLTKNMQLEEESHDLSKDEEQVKTEYLKKLLFLKGQLDTYSNATTSNVQDSNIIHTSFSSEYISSTPFFVWRNDKCSEKISELLSGHPVMLEADVRLTQKGMDAIKFRQIELHFKIPPEKESQTENQLSLNMTLKQFGVVMAHSGVSYYRFQGNFYVMVGDNQTIRYNFEVDNEGNRLGRNQIYEKFKNGDYLLSPYTLWTFQLIRASPGNSQVDFQALERFAPYVDLELVGRGIFVDVERMRDDMDVEKYYKRDDTVRDHVEL